MTPTFQMTNLITATRRWRLSVSQKGGDSLRPASYDYGPNPVSIIFDYDWLMICSPQSFSFFLLGESPSSADQADRLLRPFTYLRCTRYLLVSFC